MKIRIENERLHDFYAQAKSHTTSLKRQPKFTKGSERPKFHNTINKMRPAMSCQNLSTLTKVSKSHDLFPNLLASSCENLSEDLTKQAILMRKKSNLKLHSDVISDKDSGFGSFRSDKLTNNNNNYGDKSAHKYTAETEKSKRRERRKTVSIQLHHLPVSILST